MNITENLLAILNNLPTAESTSTVKSHLEYCESLRRIGLLKEEEVMTPTIDTLGGDQTYKSHKRYFANSILETQ